MLTTPKAEPAKPSVEPWRAERGGALIELRHGARSNLFLVHHGDGDALLYASLARRMPDGVAVFGIKPHTAPRVPIAHTRIEAMAGFYVAEMRKRQPRGPYVVGGLCAGGVLAYEMALQLLDAGEPVDLVLLFDAATPQAQRRRRRSPLQRFGKLTQARGNAGKDRRRLDQAYSIARALARKLAEEIKSYGEGWWVRARFRLLHEILARKLPWPRFIPELSPLQICETAGSYYTPKPLRGVPVVLVRANRRTINAGDTPYRVIYADETFGWDAVVEELTVIDADGGHTTMLQEPFIEPLVAALLPSMTCKSELTVHAR